MADNLQNTSSVDTVVISKPSLVTDVNSSYSKDSYSYARNATRNSREGDLGTLSNEPSNILCFNAPYKIVGHVDLPDDRVLIFSGDEVNSEIGIGDINTCTYTGVLNLKCLNFSKKFPVTGVAKTDAKKGIIVTFTDKNSPVRRVELRKLSKVKSCDEILLFKKIDHPCVVVTKGQVGNMPNGSYSVAIAYVVDNQVFSDYYSITNRIQLYSETGANSLNVDVDGLDTNFKEFALVVVGNYIDPVTKGVTKAAKMVGIYSTKIKSISVTDFTSSVFVPVNLSDLVLEKKPWQKAGIISSNANLLLLGDLVEREEENYQLKAMGIRTEYVVEQVPADYYDGDGRDVSYYRDENYDFYIQGVYNTGEYTDKFHIPGRKAHADDRSKVSSADVYEYDKQFNDCVPVGTIERWQVENTAGRMVPYNLDFFCGRRLYGHGEMGYHQSSERYQDNAAMFGEDANQFIRYHKMPDECIVPRYSTINGVKYINIIGVRFFEIPKFDSPDIVGYRITRSDRKGGNGTVVARGIMTNVRSYKDKQLNQTIMYSNYPVNDLSPDQFLSSTQTVFKNKKEHDFNPLTDFYTDKFSFYSPHTSFDPKYSLGNEVKIECEEIADISGKFEVVYKHPREKLMNQFAFWLSAAVGVIEAAIIIAGKQTARSNQKLDLSITGGISFEFGKGYKIESADDLISLNLIDYIKDAIKAGAFDQVGTAIPVIINSLLSLGLKIPYSVFSGLRQANEVFDIIYNFTGYTDYVYQYNAHADFNDSKCVAPGNKRRRLLREAVYIPSTVVSVNDATFNNLLREKTVLFEFNKPISTPSTKDNSRNTISGFKGCDNPFDEVKSKGSAFYATSKVTNPNQYGQLGSSMPVSMHSCVLPFNQEASSPVLYGGDCVIARFQFQRRMQFFNQNIANTNYPDGVEFDYRLYRNIGYPRFWIDSTKYDFSAILSSNVVNFSKFSRTTTSKHNLDCKSGDKGSIARIDDAYMYLSNNCALDFFVEVDYNINFREKTDQPFYSKTNTNTTQIFRSDRLEIPEEFKISRVYSDLYTTEIFAQQQRDDFDPLNPIPANQPNAVVYSLPSFNLQEIDNWQYFLPANFFSFRESDFGDLTGIHKLDQDRVMFLFSKASPFVTMGQSLLQLSGQTVTIGDGGLFAQDPRELMPTDNNYAACNSRWAFSNTHMGRIYPSEKQGRVINYTNSLDDVSREGISFWAKTYMPIFLYKYFPTYKEVENPIAGVGYLAVFDSNNETFYLTKRDYSPKKEVIKDIKWDGVSFKYKNKSIELGDDTYFDDISWTLSYSPAEKGWISWHDWHPDWVIQRDVHFLTVKNDGVWKHNEAYDSYCNFYGEDHPFEIEYVSASGQNVESVRNIEYLLEVYRYKNYGRNRFHSLNENFDRLFVYNSEQMSPLLNLIHGNPNPKENLKYPIHNILNPISFDIPFFKEENKYRINMFWDAVKDRGEFTTSEIHLLSTDESGYKSVINPYALDTKKPEEQRKKFRHYFTKFRLTKTKSGANKFITKLVNIKKLNSPR